MFSAPHPRFRIYTKLNSYLSFLSDLFLGRIRKGSDVERLEEALADKFEVSYVVCVSMARVGIWLALKNLIKPGQGVIMSPYTIADVVNMVICAGGTPVFADIEKQSCNIDPNQIEKLADDNTGAVLITHLHGISARVHEAKEICQRYNLPLVEDTAQAFGGFADGPARSAFSTADAGGKRLGTFGEAGIYSFGMYKNINSWYGGAVVSNDRDLIDKIRSEISQYRYQSPQFILKKMIKGLMNDILTNPVIFQPLTYWIFRYGFFHDIGWINRQVEIELNVSRKDTLPPHYLARLTPFQARLALSQLDRIDSERKVRAGKAALYYGGLKDIPDLVLPPKDDNSLYSYPVFPIQYKDRKDLLKWLLYNKRDVAAQHLKNCADLTSFSAFYRDCPVARKTASEVLVLPTYTRYPVSEVEKNIEVIQSYFRAKGR